MPKKRPGRQSNRVIDMRPGQSGDPFFETQRRLNQNATEYKFHDRTKRTGNRLKGMNLDEMFAQMAPGGVDMQGPLFHPQPLQNVSNPFAPINEFTYNKKTGQLTPTGVPWLDEGAMTVPVTGYDWGTFKTGSSPQQTNLRSIQEPAQQKSLTGTKKGRLKRRP